MLPIVCENDDSNFFLWLSEEVLDLSREGMEHFEAESVEFFFSVKSDDCNLIVSDLRYYCFLG